MKFTFWQNVISIHQSAFLTALAEEHEVILVVAEELNQERIKEKWSIPSMGNAKVIVSPNDETMSRLLDKPGIQHVFSGINGFPMVYKAFKMAIKRELKVSVMAEPYEWTGVRGWLRQQMYRWLFIRYGKNITHLFATGNIGVQCYIRSGFPENKIHQWGYFTEFSKPIVKPLQSRTLPNLIFIGKIDNRKNILELAHCGVALQKEFNRFIIIGSGPLEESLYKIIHDTPNIEYLGLIPNNKIADFLANSDLLILPSLFDGWGAVVNEALQQGTRVLCSDRCGAGSLLDGEKRGGIFALTDNQGLFNGLKRWISKGPLDEAERTEIIHWAKDNISGASAARYFSSALTGCTAKNQKPVS